MREERVRNAGRVDEGTQQRQKEANIRAWATRGAATTPQFPISTEPPLKASELTPVSFPALEYPDLLIDPAEEQEREDKLLKED